MSIELKRNAITARWKYIDLESKIWTIPLSKGNKVRYVPITPTLEKLLTNITKDKSPYIFPSTRDPKLPISSYQHHWYKAKELANLPDLRIHDLRHTFASTLVNNGRSLYEVQHLLGHSNIAVTQRYSHLSKSSLHEAASVVDGLIEG